MSGIFNNKTKPQKSSPADGAVAAPEEKIDLNKYQDVNDLSLKKIRIGLWFVEKRKFFLQVFYGLLIIIGAITWPLFIYTFGSYLFYGMNEDEKQLNELVAVSVNLHSYSPAVKAQNLIYGNIEVFDLPESKSDIVIPVKNPNQKYWAEFAYYFKIGDTEYSRAEAFVLPGEEKYLITLGQELKGYVADLQFFTDGVRWKLIDPHKYPDWAKFRSEHLNIEFIDKKYTPAQSTLISEKVNLNELEFTIINRTAYNYAQIGFPVVLFSGQNIIGVNKYIAEDFMSGQSRQIKLTWPGRLGSVTDIAIVPEVNITRDDIYLKFKGEIKDYFPKSQDER